MHTWSNAWFVQSATITMKIESLLGQETHTHTHVHDIHPTCCRNEDGGGARDWEKEQRGLCLHWQDRQLASPCGNGQWKLQRDWQGLLVFDIPHSQCSLFPSMLHSLGEMYKEKAFLPSLLGAVNICPPDLKILLVYLSISLFCYWEFHSTTFWRVMFYSITSVTLHNFYFHICNLQSFTGRWIWTFGWFFFLSIQ